MSNKAFLALGADTKNRFLSARGKSLLFGPDLGDLNNVKNYTSFKKNIQKAVKEIGPDIVACDLHPGYFSTKLAVDNSLKLKAYSLQLVQHHHAHIASVMFEHKLSRPLIGVSFDGNGFGSDGNMWGGEFLLVDRNGFRRLGHLKYFKMPGNEKSVREPWRMVLSILGKDGTDFVRNASRFEKNTILAMCDKNINCPLSSSAGRLFDAAASILGVCERASYEAEGPIKLEALCESAVKGGYEFAMSENGAGIIIDTKPVFFGMMRDIRKRKKKPLIATKFHNSIVAVIINTLMKLSKRWGIKDIALSGGVFQNRYLMSKLERAFSGLPVRVFTNVKTPVNDLNISLGQYYVLSSTRRD